MRKTVAQFCIIASVLGFSPVAEAANKLDPNKVREFCMSAFKSIPTCAVIPKKDVKEFVNRNCVYDAIALGRMKPVDGVKRDFMNACATNAGKGK